MTFDFLGKGLSFPMRFSQRTGGTQGLGQHDHIHESILQIIGTRPGERFMNPEFGSKLNDLVFEQNDQVLKSLIRHYIIEAINRWEKRVRITEVSFDESPQHTDQNILLINISYRVIRSQVIGNLVYPFHRELP